MVRCIEIVEAFPKSSHETTAYFSSKEPNSFQGLPVGPFVDEGLSKAVFYGGEGGSCVSSCHISCSV